MDESTLYWIPVSEDLPKGPMQDWVLVKIMFEDGSLGVPKIAELREGVWYCDLFEGPMEQVLNVKVIAWFDMQAISDRRTEKTSLENWAEEEVKLLCEKIDEEDIQCCNGALNALRSLIDADCSGNSILSSNLILNRLLNYRPLTPIEDTDDIWEPVTQIEEGEYKSYQCKRLSSLFKDVYTDGTVVYSDINSITCIDIDDVCCQYHSPLVFNILKDMFPITMPYMPIGGTRVYCSDFIMDPKNEKFDTLAIFHAISPDRGRIEINRFFKETEDGTWDEIYSSEYNERRILAKEREKNSL